MFLINKIVHRLNIAGNHQQPITYLRCKADANFNQSVHAGLTDASLRQLVPKIYNVVDATSIYAKLHSC